MASASEVAECFGANLRVARRQAGLTQEELSYRAGLHRTEIAHLECGKREPRISTLVKLVGALSVPPDQLLEGMAWTPGEMRAGRLRVRSDADRR